MTIDEGPIYCIGPGPGVQSIFPRIRSEKKRNFICFRWNFTFCSNCYSLFRFLFKIDFVIIKYFVSEFRWEYSSFFSGLNYPTSLLLFKFCILFSSGEDIRSNAERETRSREFAVIYYTFIESLYWSMTEVVLSHDYGDSITSYVSWFDNKSLIIDSTLRIFRVYILNQKLSSSTDWTLYKNRRKSTTIIQN